MAAATIVSVAPVRGDPGDIFAVSAPAIGTPAPQATAIAGSDVSVSQTGTLSYSYPISVPPGRNQMQPGLALSYSSQAPIYGGIAAGWSLAGIHMISQDTSGGRIASVRYQSTLAGGRPLVQVGEPANTDAIATYRAKNDASWTRYELIGHSQTQAKWRALTPDGTEWYFGEASHGTCPGFTAAYAPLTRTVDKFGNGVEYFYAPGPSSECHIDYIIWGQNSTLPMPHSAIAKFNYIESPTCIPNAPPGSQLSWRTGVLVGTGTSRLSSISLAAFPPGAAAPGVIPANPEHTRTISLAYFDTNPSTENCSTTHAPYRALRSIQESAVGIDSPQVNLPAVTFTYGSAVWGSGNLNWPAQPTTNTMPWGPVHPGVAITRFNLGWGYRWTNGKLPTVEETMIDMDGDGLLDRLTNTR